jgi:phosphoribosylformylglycinamidine cyclo-ligase
MSDDKESPRRGLTYSDSGVSIEKADQAKARISKLAASTFNSSVISGIGSFGGLFRPDLGAYSDPVLVSSADGVGTKLKLAFMTGRHNTVGVDLVSHCTDDILVMGAEPLFFLDYIATGVLEPSVVGDIVEGLAKGCREAGCVLIGGETAEMPDFYQPGEYDLAGFIVGIAERRRIFQPEMVHEGDVLVGLPSTGLHTNGYSLARRLFFKELGMSADTWVEELGKTVGDELLTPHKNYLPAVKPLLSTGFLHGMAHITGGGIPGNLNRVLSDDLDAVVDCSSWEIPPVFRYIREKGSIETSEMFRAFNMGMGMILIVRNSAEQQVLAMLRSKGEKPVMLGSVVKGTGKVVLS